MDKVRFNIFTCQSKQEYKTNVRQNSVSQLCRWIFLLKSFKSIQSFTKLKFRWSQVGIIRFLKFKNNLNYSRYMNKCSYVLRNTFVHSRLIVNFSL